MKKLTWQEFEQRVVGQTIVAVEENLTIRLASGDVIEASDENVGNTIIYLNEKRVGFPWDDEAVTP